jgi:lipopolysaccharide transport system ATP-binding protein
MASDAVIELVHLSKRFRVYDRPMDRLKEWLTPRGMSFHWAFWALRNIDLVVRRGSAVGIIGVNGAGKSTLLKILCGTLSPTAGSVRIHGRITGMLELGAGFHPEFTGRQNIYLNARLLGLSDAEIEARMPRIVEFAELGDFLDHPLRIYSTGMALRLGFSVAAHVDPDILIIDEALAVGDAYFQQKCMRYLRAFREQGGTLLFVSHDPNAVKLLCDEALLLHDGTIVERGTPDTVLDYYNALIARRSTDQAAFRIERTCAQCAQPATQRAGTFDVVITAVDLQQGGNTCRAVTAGADMIVSVAAVALADVAEPTVGISIRDRLGYEIFGTNTYRVQHALPSLRAGDTLRVAFTLPCNLGPGDYTITAAVHAGFDHLAACYDWADRFLAFKVLPDRDHYHCGVARLPVRVAATRTHGDAAASDDVLRAVFAAAPRRIVFADDSATWTFAGWHAVETIGGESVRWTQPSATFVMAAGPQGIIEIEACADQSQCGDTGLHLRLTANGQACGEVAITHAQWQTLSFRLPAALRGAIVRCTLQCDKPFVPAAVHGSDDHRTLGILVRCLRSA